MNKDEKDSLVNPLIWKRKEVDYEKDWRKRLYRES